jgi:hypothetical protein
MRLYSTVTGLLSISTKRDRNFTSVLQQQELSSRGVLERRAFIWNRIGIPKSAER